jgi:hypothetical protein
MGRKCFGIIFTGKSINGLKMSTTRRRIDIGRVKTSTLSKNSRPQVLNQKYSRGKNNFLISSNKTLLIYSNDHYQVHFFLILASSPFLNFYFLDKQLS